MAGICQKHTEVAAGMVPPIEDPRTVGGRRVYLKEVLHGGIPGNVTF